MAKSGTVRKLAAIVSADVAGFSRLMGRDEEGTLAALNTHRSELIEPKIHEHHGRLVKTIGDGLLIEFPSAVEALRCWIEVQQGMSERNGRVRQDQQILFRVGVNLGDIIVDGDDIFGDGVNVAARLETIAPAGGICISSAVAEQVRQKLPVKFEDLGKHALKNIEAPVHVYRVSHAGISVSRVEAFERAETKSDFDFTLPERPSIAIMRFRNLNRDPDDDYIGDGIGLGIQTLMVQLSGLFLVNAVSHQAYRDGSQTAAEAMRDLSVRYALEGTVQRMGERVRVTVQLTDILGDAVIWAERYDRDLEDIFALQDEITREVTTSLNVRFYRRDLDRMLTRDLSGDGVWEYFLRGVSHIYKFTEEDNRQARQMFEKLYALRPDKVQGPAYIALSHWFDITRGWTDSPADSLAQAAHWAAKAIEYDDHENDGIGHVVMSFIRLNEGGHDEALALCNKALGFRSNCPAALGQMATVQLYCGDPRRAVKSARESLAVRTMYPPMTINLLANAYRDVGEYGLSIDAAREAVRRDGGYVDALATLCSNYAAIDDIEAASATAAKIMGINPDFRIAEFLAKHPYRDKAKSEELASALRAAGLPS